MRSRFSHVHDEAVPLFWLRSESRVYAVFVDKPHARSLTGGQRAVLNELRTLRLG